MLILTYNSDNKKDNGPIIGKYLLSHNVTLQNLVLTNSLFNRYGSKVINFVW
jgi:hypothetical protein